MRKDREVSKAKSSALEASRILKGTSGTLVSLMGYNSKTSAQFIQLHDSATVPADGAVPDFPFTVAASSNFSLDVGTGIPFANGIVVTNSSTAGTKTIGVADCWFYAIVQ